MRNRFSGWTIMLVLWVFHALEGPTSGDTASSTSGLDSMLRLVRLSSRRAKVMRIA